MNNIRNNYQASGRNKNIAGRMLLKTEKLAAFFIAVIVFLTYFSFNKRSLATEYLMIAMLLYILFIKKISMSTTPAFILAFVSLLMFLFSGQLSERGFNAPIGHAMKFVYFFLTIVIANIFPWLRDKYKKRVYWLLFLTVILSLIVSIYYVTAVDIYAIRYYEDRGFNKVLDFNQIYALPILFAIILCFMFTSFKKLEFKTRSFFLAFLFLILWCIFRSLYTFALFMLMLGSVLAFFMHWEETSRTKFILIGMFAIIAVLLIFVFAEPVSNLIDGITQNWNWLVRARVMNVVDKILGTNHQNWYTSERRDELAAYSLNTFKSHPLFGVGYSGYGYGVIGCHQEWYDLLGVFGVLGSSLVIAVFIYSSYKIYKNTRTKLDKTCYLTALIIFAILGFVNPCICLPILILVYIIAPNISIIAPL